MKETKKRASVLDRYAMRWLLQKLDDEKMDTFLNGLPGYIHSPLTDTRLLIEGLKEDGVPWRIREHFMTCVTSVELSEEASMSRASACINALLLITDTSAGTTVEQAGSETNGIQPVMERLEPFCYISNSSTALRALCVRGLAIREFLVFLADLDAEESLNQKFPKYLTPLYKVIRMWKTTETAQWTHLAGVSPTAPNPLPSDKEMWADVLYDGPLINFAVLAYAILSRAHDDDIRLDMAWKMFEILLKTFSLCQVRASAWHVPGRTRYFSRHVPRLVNIRELRLLPYSRC